MSIGEGVVTNYATARGRDYPALRQFTVFLENRVGQLLEVVRRFEKSEVHIAALSINDATECAFVRFILSQPERGREILERAGLSIIETDILGIELPETAHPLRRICETLLQAEINIVQSYPLLAAPRGQAAAAFMVDDMERAIETLSNQGLYLLNEDDLLKEFE